MNDRMRDIVLGARVGAETLGPTALGIARDRKLRSAVLDAVAAGRDLAGELQQASGRRIAGRLADRDVIVRGLEEAADKMRATSQTLASTRARSSRRRLMRAIAVGLGLGALVGAWSLRRRRGGYEAEAMHSPHRPSESSPDGSTSAPSPTAA